MKSRRHRPFYRFSFVGLSLLVLTLAPVIGYQIFAFGKAAGRGNLIGELLSAAIILACLMGIVLLVAGMVALSQRKYQRSTRKRQLTR